MVTVMVMSDLSVVRVKLMMRTRVSSVLLLEGSLVITGISLVSE